MIKIKRLFAKIFGRYMTISGGNIDGKISGWLWRDTFYLDLRKR